MQCQKIIKIDLMSNFGAPLPSHGAGLEIWTDSCGLNPHLDKLSLKKKKSQITYAQYDWT